ncbi:NAD-dependent epimerase/dehydratase family protein [Flavobacterium taihuense]|uniref:NAD-dependent epimerase/dehydratase family protein n=1 Tax=Flavobacterium taihuense TaxID=2857508 RepID=A0ABS6XRX0_9FLAO|nr:NAD-dependent epimerase/dehydratase family protein [Flavobacterium taihuense]MBW4359423.1 NAD-dependent epimerase/dehydratase family protein [Flavobacterium taihuense]
MVLVTGGTGLVGAHLLIHLLEKGENVRAIYRNSDSIKKTKSLFSLYKKESLYESIHWIQADILDIPALENAFQEIRQVYHCSATISFDPKDEELVRKTNIEGTANIVNFCLAYTIQKLCHVSSIAALGDLAEHESIITEETEWNPEKPHSDYAISKYGAEMEIWRAQQEGLDVVIVNPGVIIGPGFWNQGSGELFTKVKNGLSFYTKGSTGFVTVVDVVSIMHQLMKSPVSGERFTLIGQNIIFQDLLFSIADALKVKRPNYHATPFMMNTLSKLDWITSILFGQKRQLSKASARSSYSKDLYSNEKTKNALNITFQDVHDYIKEITNL